MIIRPDQTATSCLAELVAQNALLVMSTAGELEEPQSWGCTARKLSQGAVSKLANHLASSVLLPQRLADCMSRASCFGQLELCLTMRGLSGKVCEEFCSA